MTEWSELVHILTFLTSLVKIGTLGDGGNLKQRPGKLKTFKFIGIMTR